MNNTDIQLISQWVLLIAVLASLIGSVLFSIKSRRSSEPNKRGLYSARMNVALGMLYISLALLQMFIYSGSIARVVVGALFLVLGLFNLFAGMRNHAHFTKRLSSGQ